MESRERSELEQVLRGALSRLAGYASDVGDRLYHWAEGNRVEWTDGWGWTDGFWPGLLWLAYLATRDVRWSQLALASRRRFKERLSASETHTHDLGFLFTLSAVSAYVTVGDAEARDMALWASRSLAGRYNPFGRFIRAWNEWPEDDETARREKRGIAIVDTMMNLPLLFWAWRETGEEAFLRIAREHALTTRRLFVRDDGSTVHTWLFDHVTGRPLRARRHQGFADESCWSRGQAWAIYGYALAYRYTGDPLFLNTAVFLADYYLGRLPSNGIPPWDFDAPDPVPDTSAGVIASCGLLELAEHLPDRADRYRTRAVSTLLNTARDYSLAGPGFGLITGGVSNMPRGYGVGVSLIYGDYFFLEGLLRALGRLRSTFWCPWSPAPGSTSSA